MRLPARFNRLTTWNKIGAIGAIASILGLGFVLLPNPFAKTVSPSTQAETRQSVTGNHNIQAIGDKISIQVVQPAEAERSAVDLTGWWEMGLTIESSSYNPYKGLQVVYKVHLLQESARVRGRGEKWWEGDKELPYSRHDPIEVDGKVEGSRLTLAYVLKGRDRTTTGSFEFDVSQGKPPFKGTFAGTGADVSGSVTLKQLTK